LVATNGKINVQPNVSNVIPGEATVSLDVRHEKDEVRNRASGDMRRAGAEIAGSRGLELAWTDLLDQPAVRMDEALTNALSTAAPNGTRHLVSGAGHDAMILAPHIPSAMLFLRSPGGVSHHPAEGVLAEDVDLAMEIGCRFIESIGIEYK
jgi:allantoate deiminase